MNDTGTSILLVEDDVSFMFILTEALLEEGFHVLSASNSAEALQLYRKNADDVRVAVIDVMLPDVDGLATAVEMRKIDDNIAFIFMSGYEEKEISRIGIRIEDIPRAEFFRKPFAFEDLRNRIRLLDRQN